VTLRLGVDVGGTFTDLALFDTASNTLEFAKTSSTPTDQAQGVESGIQRIAQRCNVKPSAIAFLAHGTTVATNALLERRGASCALLVTEGFRDVLHIGRQDRPKLYDWFARRPEPLLPRHLCFEVRERVLHTGEVLVSLDEAHAVAAIEAAKTAGVTAVAVCLLHAYANPLHERRLLELIRMHFPEADVSLSSEVLPEFKEYERMSTTVANAYVMPIVRHYVASLEQRVHSHGIGAGLHIMQSNGGLMTARTASEQSVRTMLSGPAAGALGAVALARQAGFPSTITVDMGGTSFDICLAHQGQLRYSKESEIGGLPIKVPMIDIHTLGAGGGSIAWIDAGGALRTGPRSAGAVPGPACYGRGGKDPTVTDANLVLGRLNADYFLGGEIALDVGAARAAIAERIATPLGIGIETAAEGIVKVINATMVRGMRSVSVEKGFDPREFVLVAFGGGGPVHASDLARNFGAPRVLVPLAPGVTSAIGLLMADLRYDFTETYLGPLSECDAERLTRLFVDLELRAVEQMTRDSVSPEHVALARSAEVRYHGQGFELEVAVPGGTLDSLAIERIREAFHAAHSQHYGYAMRDQQVVLVNAQVTAIAQLPKPAADPAAPTNDDGRPDVALKDRRRMYVEGEWTTATVYDRALLAPGMCIDGPAIVEQIDSTTVLLPGDCGRVDQLRNMIVQVAEAR
jgi:N-methylhydantoinase A